MMTLDTHRTNPRGTYHPVPRVLETLRNRVAGGERAEDVLTEFQIRFAPLRQAYLDKLAEGDR